MTCDPDFVVRIGIDESLNCSERVSVHRKVPDLNTSVYQAVWALRGVDVEGGQTKLVVEVPIRIGDSSTHGDINGFVVRIETNITVKVVCRIVQRVSQREVFHNSVKDLVTTTISPLRIHQGGVGFFSGEPITVDVVCLVFHRHV